MDGRNLNLKVLLEVLLDEYNIRGKSYYDAWEVWYNIVKKNMIVNVDICGKMVVTDGINIK